jgi:hypothetical protein
MRSRIFSVSVLAAALVAASAPSARADGLPVLGIDAGNTGVASSEGFRYVTISAGSNTIVERVAVQGGQVLAWRSVRGTFTIPAVAYDGSAGGLSADGATLVLIQPRMSFPRAETGLLVLDTEGLTTTRPVRLQGDFSFDAVSPDGSWLYFIHYVSPSDPTRYLVQAFDVRHGRLLAKPIVDPDEPGEKMRGNPLSRTMSVDGRWAYTLYDGAGAMPFVHALDTVARTAHCIDLDGIAAGTDMSRLGLGLDRTGKQLVVRDGPTPRFLVNLATLRVSRPAVAAPRSGGDRQPGTAVLVSGGGLALAAVAAGAVWARRRRREPLLENVGPQGESEAIL